MNSHPAQDAVLAELGDKITAAIAVSVSAAHKDLVTYREQHAGWVADHSERGLANWIHDRVWAHLMQRLDGKAEISMRDGVGNVVWSVVIGLEPGTDAVAIRPMPTGPVSPVVDVAGGRSDQADQVP